MKVHLTLLLGLVAAIIIFLGGCIPADSSFDQSVDSFKKLKSETEVKEISLFPVKLGSTILTLRRTIALEDPEVRAAVVKELVFPIQPKLPVYLDHAGTAAGLKMRILFETGETSCLLVLFRSGGKGSGADFKINSGCYFETRSDQGFPGNYRRGHAFSERLDEVLFKAVASETKGESLVWVPAPF